MELESKAGPARAAKFRVEIKVVSLHVLQRNRMFRSGVPKLEYMYPQGYISTFQGVH